MKKIKVVLYEDFTALDVFGPVEVLGNLDGYDIDYISLTGGIVANKQGIRIETQPMHTVTDCDILLIPGGFGSRQIILDAGFIDALATLMQKAGYTLCVCTGSALAAKTGLLSGKHATSNKTAFDWVKNIDPSVHWNRQARWVQDGTLYTSAGVSAGTDMALGFVADHFGKNKAIDICNRMEYHWNSDADHDSF